MSDRHQLSGDSQRWTARLAQPSALIALMTLAFAAGALVAQLPAWLSAASTPMVSPLDPTPVFPATALPPTPTATSPEAGDLETLYIDIAPPDLARIETKRAEALRLGILLATDDDYVPATIRVGRTEVPVELRLKGDWADHFSYAKWSLRVRTQGENYVFGMRIFSLQDPSTRSYLNEWLFLHNLQAEGVLAVDYRFVRVVLNGEEKGIYALEEGFAKELIESQQRREGLILRYDEDLVWEYRAFYADQLIPRGVNQFYIIDGFQTGRILADPVLSAQRDVAIGLLRGLWTGERDGSEVFDLPTMGRFLALSDLWNAHHGLIWHNLRYYYNPVTARLEPVAFDCHPLAADLDPAMIGLPLSAFYRDPYLQRAYVQELARISQPGYVESVQQQWGAEFEALRALLGPEFDPGTLAPPWNTLLHRQELARQTLTPHQMVYATLQQPLSAITDTLFLDVANLLDLPVEVVGLAMNGEMIPLDVDQAVPDPDDLWVATAGPDRPLVLRALDPQATHLAYARLQVPASLLPSTGTTASSQLEIVTRLWGLTTTLTQTVRASYPAPLFEGPLPVAPTVDQALAQHPYLRPYGERTLQVISGTWEVDGNLVLPEAFGLSIGPGTTLRFGRENYMLASGPLDFQGSAEAPILLQPIADAWSGVVVLQAGGPSSWNYVTVERAAAVDHDGWALTGGVTFYESPIRLEESRIVDSRGEDGINVIRTQFAFVRSEFAHTASDAFDADFAQGTVEACVFHDIGGDGIDVSGSEVQVRSVRLLDVDDKGVSVGEASRLDAGDLYFENVGYGMVSKDLSTATLSDSTIVNARHAGLAAYTKKLSYGPADLTATGITFVDTPADRITLVQTGSWIDLEGVRIWGTDVDVDALYQPGD